MRLSWFKSLFLLQPAPSSSAPRRCFIWMANYVVGKKICKYVLFIEVIYWITRSRKLTINLRLFKFNWCVLRPIYRNGRISVSGEKRAPAWVRYGKPKAVKRQSIQNWPKLSGEYTLNVPLCLYLLSCNFIKGKNKAVNCTVPCGCQHLRPWYSDAECVMHFQNRDPDMNTKLDNDTANTLSSKQCGRLTAAPS